MGFGTDVKKWYKSKGLGGALIAIVGAAGAWLQENGTSIPFLGEYGEAIAILGAILSGFGRMVATEKITL